MDFFNAERLRGLVTRTATTDANAAAIVDDIDAVLGPPPWQQVPAPGGGPAAAVTPADGGAPTDGGDGNGGEDDEDVDGDDLAADADHARNADTADTEQDDDQNGDPDHPAAVPVAVGVPNQVVYAEEIEALRAGLRSYRFRIATSPIELPANATWRQFLATFTRTYYVSATLRVADSWKFLRERLGLPDTIPTLALDTPFDIANQAELVCFSDFPSWAEQADGAMRTVAHQLARYAAEMVRPVEAGEDPQPGERGGFDGGAMVLTTSGSTAGGIADYLAEQLRRAGDDTPVRSALVLGNPRAVRAFTDRDRRRPARRHERPLAGRRRR